MNAHSSFPEGKADAAAALAGRRLAYVVGAQRSGTSWIDAMLRGHRGVHLPVLKEVHYWDVVRPPHLSFFANRAEPEAEWYREAGWLARAQRYRTLTGGAAVGRMLEGRLAAYADGETHAAYAAMLADGSRPGQVIIDNTPSYGLLGSETYAEMAALGEARFIFVMRDPVARLWSGLRHRYGARVVTGTMTADTAGKRFTAALLDPADRDVARSDYQRTIEALEASVDASRILYLFHETLFSQAAFDRVTDFLGVARRKVRPERRVNGGAAMAAPDDAAMAAARERLAPVYDFVRARFGDAVPAEWRE